jgi:deoxycytidylate deaminase
MSIPIDRIKFPELFFGFVAPIGADIESTLAAFKLYFKEQNYKVIEIKVTDIFNWLTEYYPPELPLAREKAHSLARYNSYIAYGNQLRKELGNYALAGTVINRIIKIRARQNTPACDQYTKTVFLLHQFKREEEINLFRSVYDRLFFQVSVYSRRGARVEHLSRTFAKSGNMAATKKFRGDAESICQRDEDEVDDPNGQRVAKIFHDADFIISLDIERPSVKEQVARFCDLIFSSNAISPTKMEYGLFLAKAAALRTLDLSRQVGAAIFSDKGEIIALGSNEVPKAGGGTYWCDDECEDRDYRRGFDSNDARKKQILAEIISSANPSIEINEALEHPNFRDSQLMDALEYGRIVHAEMSAICDAARTGRSTKGATLYCTTFPCHMCAKHIVDCGIAKVVFLEPYPKSLASELHNDSLLIEGADRGKYAEFPCVHFQHFFGITPRRYRELFERKKRKDDGGKFLEFNSGIPMPIIDIKAPFYINIEEAVLQESSQIVEKALADQEDANPTSTP